MLLERDDDVRALDEALHRVTANGRDEIVLVGAEADGGKSSLVRAFADAAETTGAAVWWGMCDNLRSPRPLGPLADIALSAGGPLARAFADGCSRSEIFEAALETMRTSRQPVAFVMEDLHWADDATADFLTFLGRRIAMVSTLLVWTYRSDEIGPAHPLRSVLAEVAENVHARRQLSALSVEAVGRLAAGHTPDVRALHQ